MQLMREHGTKILVGPVRDQTELQRLFLKNSDLGLALLHADAISKPPEPSRVGRSHRSHPAGAQPESDRS
jgi:hypothetical protein